MEEETSNAGKRVLPRGKLPLGAKIAMIATAAALALVVGGYLGLCAYVANSGKIVPNVSAAGISLGGLTVADATAALQQEAGLRYGNTQVSYTYPGIPPQIVSGSEVTFDIPSITAEAYAIGRRPGFFGGGWAFVSAPFTPRVVPALLCFSPQGEANLEAQLNAATAELVRPVENTSYELTDRSLIFRKGSSGMEIDHAAAKAALLSAFQSGSAAIDLVPVMTPPTDPDLNALYSQVFVAPVDAYLDKATKEIVPSVTGVGFDIPTLQATLAQTEESQIFIFPLDFTNPGLTTAAFTADLFRDVLAETKTWCSGPYTRRQNIDLACSFVNGTILLPGEEFSYTGYCGPYSVSNGYKKAGAYVNGKTVDTTAGGICQLSSTLYWATLEANLKTIERTHHGFDGGYMPITGTDATVFGDSPDFRFQNDTAFPVKLECYRDKNHNLHVKILGTSNGIHGEPVSRLISSIPAKIVYEASPNHPAGTPPRKDPERTAYNGKTVELSLRLVDAEGKVLSTTFLHKDRYNPRNGVMLYNPADAASLGIDPATGTKLPPAPAPSPTPAVSPSPAPTAGPLPTVPPSQAPGVDPLPTPTVPPVTAAPTPSPVPTDNAPDNGIPNPPPVQ
ncbi:MAG: VanW family protein, partial [Pseudoflavonifractor sp.]